MHGILRGGPRSIRIKRYSFCSITFLTVPPVYFSINALPQLRNKCFKMAKSLNSLAIGLAVGVEINQVS